MGGMGKTKMPHRIVRFMVSSPKGQHLTQLSAESRFFNLSLILFYVGGMGHVQTKTKSNTKVSSSLWILLFKNYFIHGYCILKIHFHLSLFMVCSKRVRKEMDERFSTFNITTKKLLFVYSLVNFIDLGVCYV